LHLLLITRKYPPAICGVGDHSSMLRLHLQQLGWQVSVFTATASTGPGVYGGMPWGAAMLPALLQVIHAQGITHLLWQYVPYSYDARGLPLYLPRLMHRLARCGVQQAVFFHEVALRVHGYGLRQQVLARLQRLIAHRMQRYVAVSFTSIGLYKGYLYKEPVITLPVGSNLQPNNSQAASDPEGSSYLFAFTNRVHGPLLEAFAAITQQHLKLVLAGEAAPKLVKGICSKVTALGLADRVILTGAQPAAELVKLIAEALFALQPQVVERGSEGGVSGKNGTMAALMASGKAIITCAGDMTEVTLHDSKKNCLVVPYNDAEAWGQAIERLLHDDALRHRLGAAAQHTYNKHMSWEMTARRIHEALLQHAAG
jgi:glycosyltransferase involved in cell wall biosynthesis